MVCTLDVLCLIQRHIRVAFVIIIIVVVVFNYGEGIFVMIVITK